MTESEEIKRLIDAGHFADAYERLASALGHAPNSEELMAASRVLSARIRSKCIDLACNRATDGSPQAVELEALLRKVITINGEGLYG